MSLLTTTAANTTLNVSGNNTNSEQRQISLSRQSSNLRDDSSTSDNAHSKHSSPIKVFKTEYKANFKPFDNYAYDEQTDSFVKTSTLNDTTSAIVNQQLQQNIVALTASQAQNADTFASTNCLSSAELASISGDQQAPWYREVERRIEKANEYRYKSEVGHNSRLLQEQQLATVGNERTADISTIPASEQQLNACNRPQSAGNVRKFSPSDYNHRDDLISRMANNNNFTTSPKKDSNSPISARSSPLPPTSSASSSSMQSSALIRNKKIAAAGAKDALHSSSNSRPATVKTTTTNVSKPMRSTTTTTTTTTATNKRPASVSVSSNIRNQAASRAALSSRFQVSSSNSSTKAAAATTSSRPVVTQSSKVSPTKSAVSSSTISKRQATASNSRVQVGRTPAATTTTAVRPTTAKRVTPAAASSSTRKDATTSSKPLMQQVNTHTIKYSNAISNNTKKPQANSIQSTASSQPKSIKTGRQLGAAGGVAVTSAIVGAAAATILNDDNSNNNNNKDNNNVIIKDEQRVSRVDEKVEDLSDNSANNNIDDNNKINVEDSTLLQRQDLFPPKIDDDEGCNDANSEQNLFVQKTTKAGNMLADELAQAEELSRLDKQRRESLIKTLTKVESDEKSTFDATSEQIRGRNDDNNVELKSNDTEKTDYEINVNQKSELKLSDSSFEHKFEENKQMKDEIEEELESKEEYVKEVALENKTSNLNEKVKNDFILKTEAKIETDIKDYNDEDKRKQCEEKKDVESAANELREFKNAFEDDDNNLIEHETHLSRDDSYTSKCELDYEDSKLSADNDKSNDINNTITLNNSEELDNKEPEKLNSNVDIVEASEELFENNNANNTEFKLSETKTANESQIQATNDEHLKEEYSIINDVNEDDKFLVLSNEDDVNTNIDDNNFGDFEILELTNDNIAKADKEDSLVCDEKDLIVNNDKQSDIDAKKENLSDLLNISKSFEEIHPFEKTTDDVIITDSKIDNLIDQSKLTNDIQVLNDISNNIDDDGITNITANNNLIVQDSNELSKRIDDIVDSNEVNVGHESEVDSEKSLCTFIKSKDDESINAEELEVKNSRINSFNDVKNEGIKDTKSKTQSSSEHNDIVSSIDENLDEKVETSKDVPNLELNAHHSIDLELVDAKDSHLTNIPQNDQNKSDIANETDTNIEEIKLNDVKEENNKNNELLISVESLIDHGLPKEETTAHCSTEIKPVGDEVLLKVNELINDTNSNFDESNREENKTDSVESQSNAVLEELSNTQINNDKPTDGVNKVTKDTINNESRFKSGENVEYNDEDDDDDDDDVNDDENDNSNSKLTNSEDELILASRNYNYFATRDSQTSSVRYNGGAHVRNITALASDEIDSDKLIVITDSNDITNDNKQALILDELSKVNDEKQILVSNKLNKLIEPTTAVSVAKLTSKLQEENDDDDDDDSEEGDNKLESNIDTNIVANSKTSSEQKQIEDNDN